MPATTQAALQQGNVMVFANHPSYIETFVLRLVLDRVVVSEVWSIADDKLFPSAWYESFRCIPVNRARAFDASHARRINMAALRKQDAVLAARGVVVMYPEGRRTCNAQSHIHRKDRRIGTCNSSLLERAQKKTGAALVPVWIDHGDCSAPQEFIRGYQKLFFGPRIKLTFGEPYTGSVTSTGITDALLTVGL
jgi:1-acyl-sn-glycerol-3-phosphate acyltransferase